MKRVCGVLAGLAMVVATGAWTPVTAAPSTEVSASLVTMPHVVGLKLADAQRRVFAVGLQPRVKYIDDDCTINRVAWQDPGSGTQLAPGTQVFLHVHPICNGPLP